MGLYPQRYVLYLLSSCPWLNTSGSGSTGSGSSGVYRWHSPCCRDRCRSGLCAPSFWRNLCSLHSCILHSVYLTGEIQTRFVKCMSFSSRSVHLLLSVEQRRNHGVHFSFNSRFFKRAEDRNPYSQRLSATTQTAHRSQLGGSKRAIIIKGLLKRADRVFGG